MEIFDFMLERHANEIKEVPETEENPLGLEPLPSASKEVIQSIYRFNVGAMDSTIVTKSKELSKRMIEMFQTSECYQSKTEKERQEIIQYLQDNPKPDNPYRD